APCRHRSPECACPRASRLERSSCHSPSILAFAPQRDLEVRRPVLLGVEAAAVNVSCPPEQIVPLNIDQVVLHEVTPLGQAERRKRLPENALTLPCLPGREPSRRQLVEEIRKARDHRRDLVRLVRDEVRLLCAAGDRVLAHSPTRIRFVSSSVMSDSSLV